MATFAAYIPTDSTTIPINVKTKISNSNPSQTNVAPTHNNDPRSQRLRSSLRMKDRKIIPHPPLKIDSSCARYQKNNRRIASDLHKVINPASPRDNNANGHLLTPGQRMHIHMNTSNPLTREDLNQYMNPPSHPFISLRPNKNHVRPSDSTEITSTPKAVKSVFIKCIKTNLQEVFP
ncbi:hypothetical protein MXL91_25065 [Achromobacter ruhlandii]|uniref:hypothetical protein n=1 Tax=Achromobacter ruhlandii TaxID=72557 RepID=UPI002DBBE3DE|nr:hypothetical protein [Achromobacter ruhlandii]MEB6664749.1 hypothetical protein [Achromobacter ruhlandii]